MRYLLTFDVGTTAMKCILFDEELNEKICISDEYNLITDENAFVEMDPETYFDTFCRCIHKILETGIKSEEIAAVTFTTQGETLIPTDKNGNPLHRAIVWLDARAEKEAKYIKQEISAEEIYRKTGLCSIDGALPAAKLLWLYRNQPEIYKNTYKFFLPEDFFIFRLTGRAVSEKSLVSSTGWYDIFEEKYYGKMLSVCHIDSEKLPEILPCGATVGNITKQASLRCGLCTSTVVVTGAMDQISSAIGAGNIREGIITETTGTALVVGATVKTPKMNMEQPITIYKHYDERFMYMPFCNTAGIVQKWFKDTVVPQVNSVAEKEQVSPYEIINRMAAKAPAGSNGIILFPHFAGKSEPNEIPTARGVFFGLQLGSTIEDMSRSVLEGIAFMLREILEMHVLCKLNITEIRSLGGGSYSTVWNEIKASVCGKKIVTTGYAQTTSLGAAILCAVAVGVFDSVKAASDTVMQKKTAATPNENDTEIYDKSYAKYIQLCAALKRVF